MNTLISNNIEYRQSTLAPRLYIAIDGTYLIPDSKHNPEKVRQPTKNYDKNGYPLAAIVCTTERKEVNGVMRSKPYVVNIGRLVLECWANQVNEDLEVDHIDRDPFNNHVSNLRLVTHIENVQNRREYKHANPVWLRTEEVEAKRNATRQAKKNGTYVKVERVSTRVKQKSDEAFANDVYTKLIKGVERKLEIIQQKLEYSQSRCDEIERLSALNKRRRKPEDSGFYKLNKEKIKVLTDKIVNLETLRQKYIEDYKKELNHD